MERIETMAEEAILRARMKGERLITLVRFILIGVLFLFAVFIFLNKSAEVGALKALREPAYLVEILCIAVAAMYSFRVLHQLKRDRYHASIKYVSPFIEITLLNAIVFVNAAAPRWALVMTGAPTFLYLIFLILSSFRNSPSSVLFTGIYVTVSYVVFSIRSLSLLGIFREKGNTFINVYSMKPGNLSGSRMKKIGVLFPTRS
jgi:hypothetical protein